MGKVRKGKAGEANQCQNSGVRCGGVLLGNSRFAGPNSFRERARESESEL